MKKTGKSREYFEFQFRVLKNISHDIRTNINEIQGYLAFLEEKGLDEDEVPYLLKARKASRALRHSVDKLLNFSALNANELELNREWFYLDDLIVDLSEAVSEAVSDKNLALRLDVETAPRPLYGDPKRIREMIAYLLENAVKFTEQGVVTLKVRRRPEAGEEYVTISVHDTGIGMSPVELKEVTEPYVRFVEGEKGVGLGLYFARIIAEKMGAILQIESVPNGGTTVSVSLRLERGNTPPEHARRLEGKTLAVYCDKGLGGHPDIRELKLQTLRQTGINVEIFDSEEAFSQFLITASQVPDIVSIATLPDGYERFGMLFAFLGKSRTFSETVFAAERLGNRLLPEYFDCGFEGHAGVRGYLDCLISGKKRKTTDEPLKVLIVDDLISNIEILRLFLGKISPDAEIDSAQGGYEAIGMYRNRRYDLILMDLKMPGLDGFEVLKRFVEIAPLPPVYAVTAEVYESTRQMIDRSHFNGLLEKPFNPEQLKTVVKEAEDAKNH